MKTRPGCAVRPDTIQRFLDATQSNWRNALYIECLSCGHGSRPADCGDILCAFDITGTPVLLPVPDAELIFNRTLDKSECLLTCSNQRFYCLFERWLSSAPRAEQYPCLLKFAIDTQNTQDNW